MKSWLTIASRIGSGHYQNTKNADISFDLSGVAAYNAALSNPTIPDES
jgi:hypothetical protein